MTEHILRHEHLLKTIVERDVESCSVRKRPWAEYMT